ncbi:MAG TPA: galactokinase [Nocardioidaceae bacterium]|nr:galactokinase [Nocardioidaceae bacterium]
MTPAVRVVAAGDPSAVAAGLVERFRTWYRREPAGCFMAPGRVNLIGEHVDYNEGRCLPVALPHGTYVAAAARADDKVTLTSLQQDRPWQGRLGGLGPGEVAGWPAYAAGVAWALEAAGIRVPGFDLLVDSRVPIGAGLSSSAAIECAVALALCALAGVQVDDPLRQRLVGMCVRAETEVAAAPTGGMDQAVSLLAREGHALLLDCRDDSTRHVRWVPEDAGLVLLVVDTGVSHRLTEGGYGDRRAECAEAARLLGVRSLRGCHPSPGLDVLGHLPDGTLRRRTRHVLTEMARVDRALTQIEEEDWAGLGGTFAASHASLRDDFEVSCPELDTVVDAATAAGALGARMTGGGFGGSAIALVARERLSAVTEGVAAAFVRRGWRQPAFLEATAGRGARRL